MVTNATNRPYTAEYMVKSGWSQVGLIHENYSTVEGHVCANLVTIPLEADLLYWERL